MLAHSEFMYNLSNYELCEETRNRVISELNEIDTRDCVFNSYLDGSNLVLQLVADNTTIFTHII